MPLYMDTRNHIEGLTADAAAHAHEADVKTQDKYGVKCDLDYVAGTRDRLIGRLQEKYGMTKEEAERQAEEWFKTHKNPAA